MFILNPLDLPDAGWQHFLMFFVAALLGFMIGYVSRKTTVKQLENKLAHAERALDDCENMTLSLLRNSKKR